MTRNEALDGYRNHLRNHSYSGMLASRTGDSDLRQSVETDLVTLLAASQPDARDLKPWLDVMQVRLLQVNSLATWSVFRLLAGYIEAMTPLGEPCLPQPGDTKGWGRLMDVCYERWPEGDGHHLALYNELKAEFGGEGGACIRDPSSYGKRPPEFSGPLETVDF